jgi:hypothetical protein
MGGQRGSDGVVSGDTDLGDLRGSRSVGCLIGVRRSACDACEVITLAGGVPEVGSIACEPLRVQ